jgi:hypothetical protein
MIPPVPKDVNAVFEVAVERWPLKWSLDAQAFVLARASSIRPEDVEHWLDVAQAMLHPKKE